jgi:hypothetical protein
MTRASVNLASRVGVMYHGLISIFICIVATGCAYGYAGQEGKNRAKRPDPKNVRVVEVDDREGSTTPDNEADEPIPVEPEPESSPCGVETFVVEQFSPEGALRKTIDCRTRSLADVERVPLSDNAYQTRKNNGYPVGKWYIVVDPKSVADGVLNNDNLLQMSREFELDFHGRDSESGKLIYLFMSPVP